MLYIKDLIREMNNPFSADFNIDARDENTRDYINDMLSQITLGCFISPYVALAKVRQFLSTCHIAVPKEGKMEDDWGHMIFPVEQFGEKVGMKDSGDAVTTNPDFSVYFEYARDDGLGMFTVFCQLVSQDELEEILDDVEEEANQEDDLNESENNGTKIIDKAIADMDRSFGKRGRTNNLANMKMNDAGKKLTLRKAGRIADDPADSEKTRDQMANRAKKYTSYAAKVDPKDIKHRIATDNARKANQIANIKESLGPYIRQRINEQSE